MKYSCPFCYKTMPEGYVPSAWSCCGEVGHAVAMLSDTPRTDNVEAVCSGEGEKDQLYLLARNLERQRNALDAALRERDKQLISAIAECDALLHDSGEYCKILRVLGMEEEGDAVAEIIRLIAGEKTTKVERGYMSFWGPKGELAVDDRDALLAANETLKSALRVIAESLAREDPPLQISIGYARGTALRALEEVANA